MDRGLVVSTMESQRGAVLGGWDVEGEERKVGQYFAEHLLVWSLLPILIVEDPAKYQAPSLFSCQC